MVALTLLFEIVLGWLAVSVGASVLVILLGSFRGRRSHDEVVTERRRGEGDRREGESDRRVGLPDRRGQRFERRSGAGDRRSGHRDRRATPA
jgi:hypothetical protein